MLFYTSSIEYMRLTKSGWLGLGTSTPLTKQNLHDATATTVYSSFTNLNADLGLYVGINNLGNAEIRQNEDLPISMFTNNTERFRVTRNGNNTRVAIGNTAIPIPVSMLHIGENLPNGTGAGSRNWMNIGSFIYSETDNMYVGLKKEGIDRHDAVINWGDNSTNFNNTNEGPDNLRFIFTSNFGSDNQSGSNNGVEIARMTYNNTIGRMGISETNPRAKVHITSINPPMLEPTENPWLQLRLSRMGNVQQGMANCDFETYQTGHTVIRPHSSFDPNDPTQVTGRNIGIGEGFTNAIQPQRKLHVIDNNNNAQLRLAYTQSSFSDFRTNSHGFLFINPSDLRTGINLVDDEPTQALDIYGNLRVRYLTTGTNSGLVTHETNGTLHTLAFTGNTNEVLLGNGTFGVIPGGSGTVAAVNGTWVNADGKVELGTNPLLHNTEIPFNTYSMYFTGSAKYDNIYIGYPTTQNSLWSKLNVIQDGNSGSTNIAGNFVARNGSINIAGQFSASNFGNNQAYRAAIYVPKDGGVVNLQCNPITTHPQDLGDPYLLIVNGNAVKSAGGSVWETFSDINLKKDITDYNDGLSLLRQIHPIKFKYNGLGGFNSEKEQFGIIAQELQNIIPYAIDTVEMVLDTISGISSPILTFNYGPVSYMTINAVKELDNNFTIQKNKIDSLENVISNMSTTISTYESRFNNIETLLSSCCLNNNGNHGDGNNGNNAKTYNTDINSVVNISPDNTFDKKETVLEQNVPNPFTTKTTFNYSIGTKGNVELEIITYSGQYVTTLVNTNQEEGSYSIDWNTSDIAPGIYFYTLRVNNVEWVKKAIRIK